MILVSRIKLVVFCILNYRVPRIYKHAVNVLPRRTIGTGQINHGNIAAVSILPCLVVNIQIDLPV